MRLNNLEQDTYDADRLQESEEFTPVVSPVVAPVAAPVAAPIARRYDRDNPSGLDENGFPLPNGGSKYSPTQGYGMVPVYAQQGRMSERFDDFGQPLEPVFLGYEFNPIAAGLTTVDVPKPAAILAEEKRIGKEMEPTYATFTEPMSGGDRGQRETIAYGPPTGYRYDNGQSQYVKFYSDGTYYETEQRKGEFDDALKMAALFAAIATGGASLGLGETTALSSGLGTAGAFLPTGTTSMVLSAPTTLSAWVASPFLATGSTISAVTGIAMTPEIAALLGQVVIETASNGGDAGLALKNAATSFGINLAAGQINNAISSVVNQAPSNVLSDSAKNAVTTGLTNAAIAAATGQNALSALAAAGASYITPNLLKQIPGYGDMPVELKKIGSAAIQASLLGKNPTEAALNTALQLGKQAITSYIDTTTGLSQKIKDLRTGIENSLATGVKDLTQLATDSTKTQTEDKEQAALDAKVFNANGMKLDTINDAAKAASAAGFTTFKYGDSTYNITGNFETTPTVSTTTNAAGQNQITAGSPASSVTSAGPTEGQLALTKKLNDLAALAREGENISEGEKVAIRQQEEKQQLKPGEAMFTVSDTMTPGERNQLIESTIGRATDFNEAYAAARAGYGAGKTFTWNGNSYSTSTRAEDPKLAEASDKIRVDRIATALNAGAGRGTVNDTGVRPATTVDFLKAYFGESAAKDDIAWYNETSKKILSGGYADPAIRATNLIDHLYAIGEDAIGEQIQAFAAAYSTANNSSYTTPLATFGKWMQQHGKDSTYADIAKDMSAVDKEFTRIAKMDAKDQWGAFADLIKKHPWGVFNHGLVEAGQELAPAAAFVTAAGLAVVAGVGVPAALTIGVAASAFSDAAETFGSSGKEAYDFAYKQARRSGASETAANEYANNKAVTVGSISAGITWITELAADKFMLGVGVDSLKKSAIKSFVGTGVGAGQEAVEGFFQSVAEDIALNKPLDVNSALAKGTYGAIISPIASSVVMGTGAVINNTVAVGKDAFGNNITFADLQEGKKDINYSSLDGKAVIATSANGSKITLAGWTVAGLSNVGLDVSDYTAFMPSSLTDGSTAAVTLANGKEITVGDIEDVTNNNTNITGTDFINDVSTMTPAQIVRTYTDEVLSGNTQLNTETRNNVLSQKPVNFDNTGTVLAINDNGTSLVQNTTTGAQSTVQTIGDAKVGSTVDLVVSNSTGETTAVTKTGTTNDTTKATTAATTEEVNAKLATDVGFPNYAAYTQYGGDVGAYNSALTTAANTKKATDASFPDYAAYTQYGGDIKAYNTAKTNAANLQTATAAGFPDYATFLQYEGKIADYSTAKAAETNRLTATNAGFPNYATYMEYGGNKAVYDAALSDAANTKLATTVGFPDFNAYTRYGGDKKAYDTALTDAANTQKATDAGFPNYESYTQYGGDSNVYKADSAAKIAGWKDAAEQTKASTAGYTDPSTYATYLTNTANTQKATTEGFPDYGTYTQFNGDLAAYNSSKLTAATTTAINNAISGIQFPAGITAADVAAQVKAALDANPNLNVADVTNAITTYMTANPGVTAADVTKAVNNATKNLVTNASMTSALAGVTADVKTKFDGLTQGQKDIVSAQVQQGVDLNNAINNASKIAAQQITNVKTEIGTLTGDVKTKFDALTQSQKDEVNARVKQGQDIQNAITSSQQTTSNQVQNIETNLNGRVDELVKQGVKTNEAVQQAILETQTQITKNDVNINGRIDVLVKQGVDYQEATRIAIEETKSTINDVGAKLADKIKADDEAKKAADAAALAKDIAAKQAAAKASKEAQQKGAQRGALSLLQPNAGAASDVLSQAGPLAAVYLAAKEDPNKFESPLEKFLRVQDQSLGKENQYGTKVQGNAMNDPSYSYGTQRPIEDILNMGSAQATQAGQAGQAPDASMQTLPTAVNYAQGGITGTRHGKYAQGGLSTLMMASGGKMRVDFRRGDAVTGAGDGQSDDIPAMLADGEFVFPADVVSAIGNGSTKAGSDKLYDMMHGIRAHARSAKPKDLPPQIKSPLDFLKRS